MNLFCLYLTSVLFLWTFNNQSNISKCERNESVCLCSQITLIQPLDYAKNPASDREVFLLLAPYDVTERTSISLFMTTWAPITDQHPTLEWMDGFSPLTDKSQVRWSGHLIRLHLGQNNILSSGQLHGKYYDFDSFPSETLYYKVTISCYDLQFRLYFPKKRNFGATGWFSSQPKFSF